MNGSRSIPPLGDRPFALSAAASVAVEGFMPFLG